MGKILLSSPLLYICDMSSRLEELIEKYVGKSYYFLTVTDVVFTGKAYKLSCQCRCGKIHTISYSKFGVTKSCGCYQKSSEYKQARHEWCLAHKDELLEKGRRYSQWCKDSPEKFETRNKNIRDSWTDSRRESFSDTRKQKYIDNPGLKSDISDRVSLWWNQLDSNEISQIKENHSKTKLKNRLLNLSKEFINDIYPEDVNKLYSGEIISSDLLRVRCPLCNLYDWHVFSNVYHIKNREYTPRLCSKCYSSFAASSYENEIEKYISTFYSGECIRNSRSIISPLELDLFYPEKKIAIEFNGDYWHDENHRSRDYHYNKFKTCYDNGIVLVSIFESSWLTKSDEIRQYIRDLFSDVANSLSLSEDHLMNNNYPLPYAVKLLDVIEDSYTTSRNNVYTCGFSRFETI